jgi:inner membrane protein
VCTIWTHAVVGAAVLRVLVPGRLPKRAWAAAGLLAAGPDLDAVGFWLGVPYESAWGHRGFTHSVVFAAVAAWLTLSCFGDRAPTPPSVPVPAPRWRFWMALALAGASHGLLDMLTDGGLGVALWWPFSSGRFFFPTTPVAVSPLYPSDFLSEWGWAVVRNEAVWVLLPTAGVVVAAGLLRRITRPA